MNKKQKIIFTKPLTMINNEFYTELAAKQYDPGEIQRSFGQASHNPVLVHTLCNFQEIVNIGKFLKIVEVQIESMQDTIDEMAGKIKRLEKIHVTEELPSLNKMVIDEKKNYESDDDYCI